MTDFNSIPQIIYGQVDGSFSKKWDKILLTGEIYRAKTRKKHLKEGDKAFDVSLKLTPESYKTLKAMKLDSTDTKGVVVTKGNRPLTGLKQVKLAQKDDDGNPVTDDFGEVVKVPSHVQITVRQNKQIKGQDVVVPVTMVSDGSNVDDMLAEGTKVTIECQVYETVYLDKPAAGLNLKEVKIHELKKLEGAGDSYDPWQALGLAGAAPAPQEAPAAQPETKPAPQPDADEDFDQDIPF